MAEEYPYTRSGRERSKPVRFGYQYPGKPNATWLPICTSEQHVNTTYIRDGATPVQEVIQVGASHSPLYKYDEISLREQRSRVENCGLPTTWVFLGITCHQKLRSNVQPLAPSASYNHRCTIQSWVSNHGDYHQWLTRRSTQGNVSYNQSSTWFRHGSRQY